MHKDLILKQEQFLTTLWGESKNLDNLKLDYKDVFSKISMHLKTAPLLYPFWDEKEEFLHLVSGLKQGFREKYQEYLNQDFGFIEALSKEEIRSSYDSIVKEFSELDNIKRDLLKQAEQEFPYALYCMSKMLEISSEDRLKLALNIQNVSLRTGPILAGANPKNYRTISEHSACAIEDFKDALSFVLDKNIDLKKAEGIIILTIHDLTETIMGDMPRLKAVPDFAKIKSVLEELSAHIIFEAFPEYKAAWLKFENKQGDLSMLLNDIDKIESPKRDVPIIDKSIKAVMNAIFIVNAISGIKTAYGQKALMKMDNHGFYKNRPMDNETIAAMGVRLVNNREGMVDVKQDTSSGFSTYKK